MSLNRALKSSNYPKWTTPELFRAKMVSMDCFFEKKQFKTIFKFHMFTKLYQKVLKGKKSSKISTNDTMTSPIYLKITLIRLKGQPKTDFSEENLPQSIKLVM